jgi:hypothetical protein
MLVHPRDSFRRFVISKTFLKEESKWVADASEDFPFLEPLLQQLAPLLLVTLNLLYVVIDESSMLSPTCY